MFSLARAEGRRQFHPQVLPFRIVDGKEALAADYISLALVGEVTVGEQVKVPDHYMLHDGGISQQQERLPQGVEADNGFALALLVELAEGSRRRRSQEDCVAQVAEEPVSRGRVDAPTLPVGLLLARVEVERDE